MAARSLEDTLLRLDPSQQASLVNHLLALYLDGIDLVSVGMPPQEDLAKGSFANIPNKLVVPQGEISQYSRTIIDFLLNNWLGLGFLSG